MTKRVGAGGGGKSDKKIIIRKIKKKGHGGHHGGSWKVAYADFVTAMMAFFLVMWILGMDQNLKRAVEGYFSNPVGYKKGYGSGRSPISSGNSPGKVETNPMRVVSYIHQEQQFAQTRQRIQNSIGNSPALQNLRAHVEIVVTRAGLRIELVEGTEDSTGTFFSRGSAELKEAGRTALEVIGAELRELHNPVIIEGHTDATVYGDGERYTNWELSTDRANAARRVLESGGLGAWRVVEVKGLAAREPRDADDPFAASNRRITILLPFTVMPTSSDTSSGIAATVPGS